MDSHTPNTPVPIDKSQGEKRLVGNTTMLSAATHPLEFVQHMISSLPDATDPASVGVANDTGTTAKDVEKTASMSARVPVADMGSIWVRPRTNIRIAKPSKKRAFEEQLDSGSENGDKLVSSRGSNAKKTKSQDQTKTDGRWGPTLEPDSVSNQTDELVMSILKNKSITGNERHKLAPKFFGCRGFLLKNGFHVLRMRDDKGELLINKSDLEGRSFFFKSAFGYEKALRSTDETRRNPVVILKYGKGHQQYDQITSFAGSRTLPAMRKSSTSSNRPIPAIATANAPPKQRRESSAKLEQGKKMAEDLIKQIQAPGQEMVRKLKLMEVDMGDLRRVTALLKDKNAAQELRIAELEAVRQEEKKRTGEAIATALEEEKRTSEKTIAALRDEITSFYNRDTQWRAQDARSQEEIDALKVFVAVIQAAASQASIGTPTEHDLDGPAQN